ncbi:DUF1549 domain-containing protein [Prosthecobacter sp. SYSU 5D2]|uniref:DUF1549 domain-containing protein n=1 Tax=Prosthecobacter sp. SYSU 5D2 TaxID=3134134 RepID=UPI0031FEBAD7
MKRTLLPLLATLGSILHAEPISEPVLQAAAARIDAAFMERREEEKKLAESRGLMAEMPPRASDLVFLRRACMDLAGRLPAPEEIRQFIADPSENKRAHLVDQLLAEPGANEVRFRSLAEALRIKDDIGQQSQAPFIRWLRQEIAKDTPYDQLIATMLRSDGSGDLATDPAAGMLQRDEGDMLHTSSELARALLGADLHCAQCHNHPFADFTQKQSYEFAACFVPEGAPPVTLPRPYYYRDGKPGQAVDPKFLPLDQIKADDPRSAFQAGPHPGSNRRNQLALWFNGPNNKRFSEMSALRLWQRLSGFMPGTARQTEGAAEKETWHDVISRRGCDTPPSWNTLTHSGFFDLSKNRDARILQTLGEEFIHSGSRQREFLRILARTEAYQRESVSRAHMFHFVVPASPRLRRIPPHITWDAWATWLPAADADAQTSTALPQVPPPAHPLRLLGQGTREWADETAPVISHGLARFMMASPLITRVSASEKLVLSGAKPVQQVEHLFLTTLGRFPEEREQTVALAHLAAHPESGTQDIAWALLNTSEFLFLP